MRHEQVNDPGGRAEFLTRNIAVTTQQLELHFRKLGAREGKFKKHRLALLDKELQHTQRIAAREEAEAEAAASPQRAVGRSPANSRPSTRPQPRPGSRGGPGGRLDAGAAEAVASEASRPGSPGYVTIAPRPNSSPSGSPFVSPFEASLQAGMLSRASTPGFRAAGRATSRRIQREKLTKAFEQSQALERSQSAPGAFENLNRPPDVQERVEHGKKVEQLGNLMALLGPRYKTLSKDLLWEQAALSAYRFRRSQRGFANVSGEEEDDLLDHGTFLISPMGCGDTFITSQPVIRRRQTPLAWTLQAAEDSDEEAKLGQRSVLLAMRPKREPLTLTQRRQQESKNAVKKQKELSMDLMNMEERALLLSEGLERMTISTRTPAGERQR